MPVENLVKNERLTGGDPEPFVVWFYSREQEKDNRTLETGTFADEGVALLMQRFKRVKIDVDTIKEAALAKEYGETPGFVVIDPNGEVMATLAGKAAMSRSRFKGFLGHCWDRIFTMSQKEYTKLMGKILDRLDRVSGSLTVLQAKKARLAKRPNPGKARQLEKEEAALKEEEAKIVADEDEIKKACGLRDKYLPSAGDGDSE